jgi:hypothetical protein
MFLCYAIYRNMNRCYGQRQVVLIALFIRREVVFFGAIHATWPTGLRLTLTECHTHTYTCTHYAVAVQLAGVSDFEGLHAGKPDCYGSWVVMAVFCVCIGLCLTAELFRLAAGYLEKPQVTKGLCSWLGPDSVRVPALRRRSVGPPPSAIHGGGRLSRHPCRSAHCAPPAFGLHPSRDLW